MSGICGFMRKDRDSQSAHLDPMIRALAFRKDGDSLSYCHQGVGLGVLKVARYQSGIAQHQVHGQPIVLAFHGSLYPSRGSMETVAAGMDLTHSLLRLYLERGIKFLKELRGEFVISLWDGTNETLSLAVDRFRIQPLFYCEGKETLLFSSRMQSLLAYPLRQARTINPQSLVDVMAYSAISTPATIFKEVHKLPPGHVLRYRNGITLVTRYWDINFTNPDRSGEAVLAEHLKERFADAVAVRIAEDGAGRNVGAFLSGGIDSSTVTGVLSQITKAPVRSFSIGFSEEQFNELAYARITAKRFASELHEYLVTPEDTLNLLPILLDSFDEPFANASAVPTYFCAKMALAHGVDVMYAGDGGDELFGGNERYSRQRLLEYWTRCPYWLREGVLRPLVSALADGTNASLFVKGMKYIQRASIPYPDRIMSYGLFNTLPLAELFDEGLVEALGKDFAPYGAVHAHYSEAPAKDELDRQLYIDLKLTISDNDIIKVTRMTEAAGVAVRFPFLDHELAEFAATVPARMKMKGRELRSFFKQAYADVLPLEVRTKTKHGFGLPIPVWLQTHKPLNELMRELVLGSRTVQRGVFRRKALEDFVRLHQNDSASFYGAILWNVMIIEMWYRKHIDRSGAVV